ncbi:lysozyme inhibitor LprI family protein [Pseudovibrio flavus]|uniref:lysozyme inhibitor LprI family protein n=1 Tax=Pseudovibrio flavus TaxID=2529854 RepID=UPI00211C89F7|nr:lysozyme inhibitor LprI family protein [Pseudovibrio flavus]
MRAIYLLAIAFSSLSVGSALAKTDCSNVTTQVEMNNCTYENYQLADKALNAAYAKAMAFMKQSDSYIGPDEKRAQDALVKAQRDWIAYRDSACVSYGFLARGGTLVPTLENQCLAKLTEQRTKDLKDIAQGLGN